MRSVVAVLVAVLALAVVVWATKIGCDSIYRMGEIHGRYVAEISLSSRLRQCHSDLDVSELLGGACDRALLECQDGARYVSDDSDEIKSARFGRSFGTSQ